MFIAICSLSLTALSFGAQPAASPAGAEPPPPVVPTPPGGAVWRGDLAHLLSELPQKHVNAFAHCSKDDWLAAAAELEKRLSGLTDRQAYLELSRLVAMLGDAHTSLSMNALVAPRRVPAVFAKFSDGLFLIGATQDQEGLIGRRVVKIGGRAAEEVHKKLGELVSADNDVWRARQSLALLTDLDALSWAGVPVEGEGVVYAFADASGGTEDVTLRYAPKGPGVSVIKPDVRSPSTLISRRQRQAWYGVDLLHGPDKVVYAWYDRCAEQGGANGTVAAFAQKVIERFDAEQATRLVIDLRSNAGGNSLLLAPLIDAIARHDTLKKPGMVYVLIGQTTYSSGMMNALQLKRAGATLVGTPTGQKPNSFGEVRAFDLPGSKLKVFYSTKVFRQIRDADPASLLPDIEAPISSADWFDPQRDPALEAARKHGR